jgi:hypothetical protein
LHAFPPARFIPNITQEVNMNKKFWTGFVVVFVVMSLLEWFFNEVMLSSSYQATANLWRPMGEMKIWLFYVVYLFVAYFFTLIFSKGYEGKGIMEGLRYGFFVGMMMAVPMAYGTYAAMPIPYSLALSWFICGLIEYVVCGILLAVVFGKQAAVTKVAAA